MEMVRLYGKVAATLHYQQAVIQSEDGHIDVPSVLVPHMLSTGWTLEQPDEIPDTLHRLDGSTDVGLESGAPIS